MLITIIVIMMIINDNDDDGIDVDTINSTVEN